jgi:hypothetical protein
MERIKTTGAHLDSAAFTNAIINDYEAMGEAVAKFGIGAQ